MKKATMTMILALTVLGFSTLSAQMGSGFGGGNGLGFLDENLDGINDLAPDTDLDGIPNGMDEDFTVGAGAGRNFVDEDGDGFNDNSLDADGDGIINCEDDDFVRTGGSKRQINAGSSDVLPARTYSARAIRLHKISPSGY